MTDISSALAMAIPYHSHWAIDVMLMFALGKIYRAQNISMDYFTSVDSPFIDRTNYWIANVVCWSLRVMNGLMFIYSLCVCVI